METLTLEQCAALLDIPTGIAARNLAQGCLPFIRYGDGFISTHAAASAVHSDPKFLDKLRDANAKRERAIAAPKEAIERLAEQRESADRKDRDDAAHARYQERIKREGLDKQALEVAANGVVRRA
jgi:hypothetical protein